MTTHPYEHLPPEVVAAYLERCLPPEEEALVQDHLARCGPCRREVVEVGRLVRSGQPRPGWQRPLWAAAAAVAVLALGTPLVQSRLTDTGPGVSAPDRSPAVPAVRLEARAPGEDVTVDAGATVVLTWSAAPLGGTFRVSLLDDRGNRVWSAETGDTTAVLPASVTLEPDRAYFWYVDALGPDGRSTTTGPRRLLVR